MIVHFSSNFQMGISELPILQCIQNETIKWNFLFISHNRDRLTCTQHYSDNLSKSLQGREPVSKYIEFHSSHLFGLSLPPDWPHWYPEKLTPTILLYKSSGNEICKAGPLAARFSSFSLHTYTYIHQSIIQPYQPSRRSRRRRWQSLALGKFGQIIVDTASIKI